MSGLTINTTARPMRVLDLSKAELELLKESAEIDPPDRIELLRVIDTLLSSRLPDTDDKRPIVNLMSYKHALENNRDTLTSIRSVVLRELDDFISATQAGGVRRKTEKFHFSSKRHHKRTKRRRTRRHR